MPGEGRQMQPPCLPPRADCVAFPFHFLSRRGLHKKVKIFFGRCLKILPANAP